MASESKETGRGRLERFTKKLHLCQDPCPKYWYDHQKRQGTSVMGIDLSDGWGYTGNLGWTLTCQELLAHEYVRGQWGCSWMPAQMKSFSRALSGDRQKLWQVITLMAVCEHVPVEALGHLSMQSVTKFCQRETGFVTLDFSIIKKWKTALLQASSKIWFPFHLRHSLV